MRMKNTKVMTSTRRIEDDPEARHQRAHASSRRRRDTDADVSTAAQSSSTPAPGPSYSMAQVSPQRTAYQGDPSSTESSEDYYAEEDAILVDLVPKQQGPEVEAAEQADQGVPLEVGIKREPPFPGGPEDLSLLWSYADHKAPWTWRELLEPEGRHAERQVGAMKVSTVGGKAWHLDF